MEEKKPSYSPFRSVNITSDNADNYKRRKTVCRCSLITPALNSRNQTKYSATTRHKFSSFDAHSRPYTTKNLGSVDKNYKMPNWGILPVRYTRNQINFINGNSVYIYIYR